MAKRFSGSINIDIRDSVPDWALFEPVRAAEGAPSVVYRVWAFPRWVAMEADRDTEHDRIAADGARFTQWQPPRCVHRPVRAC